MKKLGFTLAEALLTLGIIGVVAALTLPSVTLEHRKRTYSASLAAAVSDLETAMSVMIMRDGVDNLLETRAWKYVKKLPSTMLCSQNSKEEAKNFNEHVKFFSQAIGGEYTDYYPEKKVYKFNKAELDSNSTSGLKRAVPFEMKNGITYFLYIDIQGITKKDEDTMLNNGTNLYANAADVWIDVNGKNKPNTVGRDIFYFILGADGKLYPFGGKDHLNWLGGEDVIIEDSAGFGKTAELVKNNYKMNY